MDNSSNSNNALQLPQIIYDDPQYIKHFTDGREDLLKLAFVGHERVNVETSLSGYSGAQTWRVSTEKNQFFVVKLAHPTVIDREDDNYRNHVAGGLYRNAAHPEDRPFKSDNKRWALFKSTFLGLYQSQTLLQYLDKGSADIATILKNIFIDHGRRWWGAGESTPIKCSVYYDRLLPAHLELDFFDGEDKGALLLKAGEVTQSDITSIEEMVIKRQTPNILLKNFRPEKIHNGVLTITAVPQANVRSPQIKIKLSKVVELVPEEIRADPNKTLAFLTEKLEEGLYANNVTTRRQRIESYAEKAVDDFSPGRDTFVVESMRYPNPIVYLQRLLNENYNTKISPRIHGDLNLANILIELDESNEGYQQPWLIDFAETGEGPILLDLQWLEEQVITKFLVPMLASEMTKAGLSVNALVDILEALHEFKPLPRDLPSTLQKPYTVLQEIRRLVRDNNYLSIKNDWSEYYRGLVIALVGSLRFEELGLFVQKVAFLSAATIIRWTKVSPSDLPKRPVDSPKPPISPPIIESNSLPDFILPGRLFKLRGQARADATIQVLANKEVLETTVADHAGNWQAEIGFDKAGNYRLTVRYERATLESGSSSVRVIEPPRIKKESIPEQIFIQKRFVLHGSAQPSVVVQIFANQQSLTTAMADDAGHWQAQLILEKVGSYTIVVRDENHKVESAPVLAMVLKREAMKKIVWLPLLIGALLLAVATTAVYRFPETVKEISQTIGNQIFGHINTPTPSPTPSSVPSASPTPDWDSTAVAACNAIKARKLAISASDNSGPYTYRDKNGNIAGFEIDLIKDVIRDCLALGPQDSVEKYLTIEPIKVAERKQALQADKVQVVLGSVSNIPERCNTSEWICTDSYAFDEQALAVRKDGPFQEYCAPDLSLIAVITGTTGATTFDKYKRDCSASLKNNFEPQTTLATKRETALQWVVDSTVNAYKANKDLIKFVVDENPVFKDIKIIAGGPREEIGMWLRADKHGLRTLIDNTIAKMRSDGRFKRICERHFIGYGKDCNIFPISRSPQILLLGSAIAGSGSDSPLARDQQVGLEIAFQAFNTKLQGMLVRLNLVPRESGSTKETAIQAFRELLTQNVIAIVGPTYSFQLFSIFREAELKNALENTEILIFSTSATADNAATLSDHNFRTSAGVKKYAGYAVDAMLKEHNDIKNVVLAHLANDEFTDSESQAFREALKGYQIEPNPISYINSSADFTRVVSDIVKAKPDLVIISGLFGDGSKILNKLSYAEYTGKIIIGNGLNTTEIFKFCEKKCDGIYIAQAYNADWKNPGNQEFLEQYADYYRQHHKDLPYLPEQPSQITAQMYTAIAAITEALIAVDKDRQKRGQTLLRDLDLNDSKDLVTLREELNNKLLTTADKKRSGNYMKFDSPLGPNTWFDQDGDIQQDSFCVAEIKMQSEQEGEFEIKDAYRVNCNP